jgi:hypothetical protein
MTMSGTSNIRPNPVKVTHHKQQSKPWGADALQGLDGAVTLYGEFRVIQPQNDAFLAGIDRVGGELRDKGGFINLALKQMSGDSTMVKNYPEAYKGVLATAFLDGAKSGTQPIYYSLFVRFAKADQAAAVDLESMFTQHLEPHLHAGASPQSPELVAYRGVFQTVGAGDRTGIYTDPEAVARFLHQPVEQPERETVTVENHVEILDVDREVWEPKVMALLEVAQDTFQPQNDPNGIGQPGTRENRLYRKALTTEILRNANPDGALRSYIMHGVWESVWDHENSHIDPRFLTAAGPVGAKVVIGPVEPFYLTRKLFLRA